MRYLLFFMSFMLFSCTDLEQQINTMETEIGVNPDATDEDVRKLLAGYEAYAQSSGADEQKVVDYLLRAGDVSTRLKDYNRTLGYYNTILEKYPNSAKASKALFMKAFTLDNRMKKLDEAKVTYEEFLEKYPEDDFAKDAAFSLRNLGKSAEDIIKEFEQQKQESQ